MLLDQRGTPATIVLVVDTVVLTALVVRGRRKKRRARDELP
jgi:hypothetical protein